MKHVWQVLVIAAVLLALPQIVLAAPAGTPLVPSIDLKIGGGAGTPQETSSAIQLLLILTVLSVAPAILLLMTSFTRIVIVLSFVRNALATQQMPPNQVLIALALFMTFFIMAPTLGKVNETAVQPFMQGKLTQQQAFDTAVVPFKEFMAKQTREKDLALFMEYTKTERPKTIQDIPLSALVPAYAISELKTAFQIGFMIFIPFLVIDMVISSILMGMGMMMLPPVMISLPFKILLFIMVDGWYLVVKSLLISF
ncbi:MULTISPECIES: flagellar type III secretion system pore protein FliP [Brevibacillus]|jgi:flagellar biosynthetic protein FliP|uniref:Flagellar biosynthetic protein FliP n=2 Tax=Brevibacillus TaxID=55080 RepID=A0A1I3NRF2_9BACL|nr:MULTISPECIES: flagellar type III secretion system pore protein FliP [Brevibacillus]MED1794413.1 flagellar type III secretion system pore protein FliP [Brevibacillus nitrificans]MED1949171.1 flagellar type III secretion system pore protein FliP [Brevibacillus centrosporus]MED4909874.1 flagellar type III secretion system pore protein FliP [Brevibacillus centrosporus]RNB88116.1 flagellar biosynthetic protein FliP [Brevibacillus nitrificans]SFJ11779.1 flagellar biosynthetic protein FliP [Brevib